MSVSNIFFYVGESENLYLLIHGVSGFQNFVSPLVCFLDIGHQ